MPRTDGIDISHHQGRVAWGLVPTMQLGTTKLTDGVRYPADKVAVHVGYLEAMRSLGWRWVGCYHWLRSTSPVRDQVDFFWNTLRDKAGGLGQHEFVQLDWEITPNEPVPTSDMAQEWADRVNQLAGRETVITYSSDWLPDSTLDPDSRAEFDEWRQARPHAPLWFANYNTGTGPTGGPAECARYGADVWQWTGRGRVPGIVGDVDCNEVLDPTVLDRLCGYQRDPGEARPPTTVEDDVTQAEAYDVLTLWYAKHFPTKVGPVKPVDPGTGTEKVTTQQQLADVLTLWHAANPGITKALS